VDQYATHSKRGSHLAGMLAPGTTEANERELLRIMAGTQGDMPHGIGHGAHSHGKKVFGQLRTAVDVSGHFSEGVTHSRDVEPFIGGWAEDLRETFR